ncbi:DUF6318 family protein [uncultured Rothia sp.]|uniref:DUF6318 family protein n=1 Tax=uncultured Rothia sp. TaxID=316088 RepID=UPI0028EBD297|nr:DUF6318 family protein [uncultured Rothia sp.]
MTSTLLTRRAVLSGGTLLGLTGLLAACSQQANNEAAATASAPPSETASASAAASELPSASATPSTVRGYSGGSKAPDGEYRPADKYGNAQNVPKPNAPEEGYREKSIEGMRKTLKAWVEWANYGTETGDYSMARQFVSSEFKDELQAYADVEDLYASGGWIIGGVDYFEADGAPWSEGGETYFWKAYRHWDREIYVESDGSSRSWVNEDKTNDTFKFTLTHNGDKWEIMNYENVGD